MKEKLQWEEKGNISEPSHFKTGVPSIGFSIPYPSPSGVVPSMCWISGVFS